MSMNKPEQDKLMKPPSEAEKLQALLEKMKMGITLPELERLTEEILSGVEDLEPDQTRQ